MMVIHLESGATRNKLGQIAGTVQRPRTILQAAARGAMRILQRHFQRRDRKPNRLGGRRTHFWLDILRSTQLGAVDDRQATVRIGDHRFSQKLRGGRIVAKTVRSLTIPVDPEAHGRRAAVFERETGLTLFAVITGPTGSGIGVLATRADGSPALQVRYILTPSVNQRPDKEALPDRARMEAGVREAAEGQLRMEIQRPAPPGGAQT